MVTIAPANAACSLRLFAIAAIVLGVLTVSLGWTVTHPAVPQPGSPVAVPTPPATVSTSAPPITVNPQPMPVPVPAPPGSSPLAPTQPRVAEVALTPAAPPQSGVWLLAMGLGLALAGWLRRAVSFQPRAFGR